LLFLIRFKNASIGLADLFANVFDVIDAVMMRKDSIHRLLMKDRSVF
jgi:hypothetical protein